MRHVLIVTVLVGALAIAASPALAHHSLAAQFDENQPITLDGVISRVEWINPHVYLHVDVTDGAGKTTSWAVETFPPTTLRRGGLTKEKLGLGQKVSLLTFKARNDSPLAFLRKITFADGRELVIWLGDAAELAKAR
jgi:Family of unknown function (DUF6152)